MRYTKEMYEKDKGKVCYGRILSYNYQKGYGFIRTEEHADLFLSSKNIGREEERNVVVGAMVSFSPMIYKDKYTATNFCIIEKYPAGETLILPSGKTLHIRNIVSMGLRKNIQSGALYVHFTDKRGYENIVSAKDVKAKGKVKAGDIKSYWNDIRRKYLDI